MSSSNRAVKAEFRKAKDILKGAAMADAALQRELERKCDWDDPEDVALYRSSCRESDRVAVLDRLVPDRKCPGCGHIFAEIRSWVINRPKTRAVCRSCYHSHVPGAENVDMDIFSEPEIRFRIDGNKLVAARSALGLSQRKFAKLAGWTHSYQYRLESGPIQTVGQERAEVILQVLRERREFLLQSKPE